LPVPLRKDLRVCQRRRGDKVRMRGERELPWLPLAQRWLRRQARCGATLAASANRWAGAAKWLVGMRKAQPLVLAHAAERGAKPAAHKADIRAGTWRWSSLICYRQKSLTMRIGKLPLTIR